MWFDLCAARSTGLKHKKYSKARDSVAKKMTSSQIAKAQGLAREWKPKKEVQEK